MNSYQRQKRRKRRATRKRIAVWLIIVGGIAAFTTFLLLPVRSRKFRIVFDEEKIKYREDWLAAKQKEEQQKSKPNIIFILADDLGKMDISLYGCKHLKTPNIDAIGENGVTFQEGYISSPICSPSRAGLMTGRYQQRFGFELNIHERYPKNRLEYFVVKNFIANKGNWRVAKQKIAAPSFKDMHKQGLPPTEFTMAEILQAQGYQTAMFGKWHLGYNHGALPINRGFDYHYGFYEAFSLYAYDTNKEIINQHHDDFSDKHIWGKGRKGNCAIRRNDSIIIEEEYLTTRIGEEASDWMEENHKNGPFFMYVPFSAPHTPFQATKKYYDHYAHIEDRNKRVYYAMIHALDDAVGMIVDKVRELGIEENTMIVFLSDNGGATYTHATDNGILKGGKFSNFEGGINVPFMIQWEGTIPAATQYEHPVSALDLLPTFTAIGHTFLPEQMDYDGVNLMPYILGEKANEKPHEALYWRSLYHKAIRKGRWKLIRDDLADRTVLYDLVDDKPEKHNLANECNEIVEELMAELKIWEQSLIQPNWPRVMDYRIIDGDAVYYFPL
jgi:arylsulfatase A-like enzyme